MRVLYATGYSIFPHELQMPGGNKKLDLLILEGLASQGIKLHVISSLGKSGRRRSWRTKCNSQRLYFTPFNNEWEQLQFIIKFQNKFDVLHISSNVIFRKSELVEKLHEISLPIIFSVTGSAILDVVSLSGLRYCSVITCLSNDLRSGIEKLGYSNKKIRLIPSPINRLIEKPYSNIEKHRVRTRLNKTKEDVIFAYIGRITKRKNIHTLLSYWVKFCLAIQRKKPYLLLLGAAPEQDYSMKKLEYNLRDGKVENVICTGWTNIDDYLPAVDYVISASLIEGLSYAFLESIARSIPCIGPFQTPGNMDIIINQKNGFLYDGHRCQSFVEALTAAYQIKKEPKTYEYMQKMCKKQVRDMYSIESVSEKFLKEYRLLIESGDNSKLII